MPNPHPVPYTQAKHKENCGCPACRRRQGLQKTLITLRLDSSLVKMMKDYSEQKGQTLTASVEEAFRKLFP